MNDNVKNLVKLITENPTLKVLPMVDSCLLGDDYSRYSSSIGESRIDEVYYAYEKVYFRSNDNDDEIQEDELDWEKVIVVDIDLP